MKWIVVSIFVLLAGCSGAWWVDDAYDPAFDIPPTRATTAQGVCRWVAARVWFLDDDIHDRTDYWQSPDQTYEWGRGDCEDYAILVMYLIHRDLGGWPALVSGRVPGSSHAWVFYDGRYYEPQSGRDVTDNPDYEIHRTIEYGEALWRSENWHASEVTP